MRTPFKCFLSGLYYHAKDFESGKYEGFVVPENNPHDPNALAVYEKSSKRLKLYKLTAEVQFGKEDNFPTKKPKPAEPKFKIGDELVWDKHILVKIDEVFADGKYLVFSRNGNRYMVKESDLEPYSEPVGTKDDTKGNTKDPTFTDDCKSQCKSPDRLRIAAMAMEGILSKGELAAPNEVTDMALIYADELIKKCEEGSTL